MYQPGRLQRKDKQLVIGLQRPVDHHTFLSSGKKKKKQKTKTFFFFKLKNNHHFQCASWAKGSALSCRTPPNCQVFLAHMHTDATTVLADAASLVLFYSLPATTQWKRTNGSVGLAVRCVRQGWDSTDSHRLTSTPGGAVSKELSSFRSAVSKELSSFRSAVSNGFSSFRSAVSEEFFHAGRTVSKQKKQKTKDMEERQCEN